jgi:hypothetical protein
MPRTRRLIINDETAVYHVMSRTALDGFPLKDIEKDFMLDLISCHVTHGIGRFSFRRCGKR